MKSIVAVIAVCLVANIARGYVYSYQDTISLNAKEGEVDEAVLSGPNAPPDIYSVGGIAMLESGAFGFGSSYYGNNGVVESVTPSHMNILAVAIKYVGPLGDPEAAALAPGDIVGPSRTWSDFGFVGGYATTEYQVGDPAFLSPQGAYVGIEFFDANNQTHYGWLLVRYDQPPGTYFGTIELMEAAYETDPGVPITIVPEPGGIAILGVFAIGAAIHRRRW